MKKCIKCGAEFEGNFCPACGAQYEEAANAKVCPKCGKPVELDQRFCDACGYSFDAAQAPAQPAQPVQPAQPAYTQPPVYIQPAPQPQPAKSGSNGLALAGFILAFFGVQPIALILSIVGLVKSKEYGGNGKGLAIAGIILGALSIGLFVILWIAIIGVGLAGAGMDGGYSALAALSVL